MDTDNEKPLLSIKLCNDLGLLSDLVHKTAIVSHTTINKLYHSIGTIRNKEYRLAVDTSITPVKVPPRRTPPALFSKVTAKLKELQDADIMEFEWSSPLVPVIKKMAAYVYVRIFVFQIRLLKMKHLKFRH